MLGLIGKKVGMTSIFDDKGRQQNCTVLEVGPCTVVQVKTTEKDGYSAMQLGFGKRKEKNMTKPVLGHFKKAGVPSNAVLGEFRVEDPSPVGTILNVDIFQAGEIVDIIGTSKGRGFQGVVKRHGFGGVGSRSHGQHDRERAPGSVGSSSYPSRVFKGLKMAGQTGDARVTSKNLQVIKVMPESNLILVRGAVPGANNGIVQIIKQSK